MTSFDDYSEEQKNTSNNEEKGIPKKCCIKVCFLIVPYSTKCFNFIMTCGETVVVLLDTNKPFRKIIAVGADIRSAVTNTGDFLEHLRKDI